MVKKLHDFELILDLFFVGPQESYVLVADCLLIGLPPQRSRNLRQIALLIGVRASTNWLLYCLVSELVGLHVLSRD